MEKQNIIVWKFCMNKDVGAGQSEVKGFRIMGLIYQCFRKVVRLCV